MKKTPGPNNARTAKPPRTLSFFHRPPGRALHRPQGGFPNRPRHAGLLNCLPHAGLLVLALAPFQAWALPDDKDQEIKVDAASSEVFLDQGVIVYYGSSERPAVITQGSLKITGLEITIERDDGEITKIIVNGDPAHFQQQPAVDEAMVYASGGIIDYDDTAQLLTVSESARLTQDGNVLTGHRIEYEIEARKARAEGGVSEDRVNMVFPPRREE